ncbi:ATP-binding protein [Pseudomonas sp. NFACC37-1]|uniref:ATP-binding protein n=1 Tax=Pseudomonas sp. NFACC37-1 TaxID=1566196 RepID=UPI00088C0E89|nr:ATP-binding protein [Pseudomonas sp. NFACC37-1]SCY66491.1 Putative DNA-binding domain-containing protein [Pseudomonas sp. NFACC37-1]
MAIDFKCSAEKVELFYKGAYLMDSPRNRKLQVSGVDFLSKLNGTRVEDIPPDISFYIGGVQDFHSSLSALSLDNSERGMAITIQADYMNLGAWIKPFSFDEYLLKIESLIEGILPPIKKYYKHDSATLINYTILGLDFFVRSGDLLNIISSRLDGFARAQREAERVLYNQSSSSHTHLARELNFVEGKKFCWEEDLTVEFKEVKGSNPVKSIQNLVDEYILAFFNSQGGSVFWGINDDGIVTSMKLTPKMKDDIRKSVSDKINVIEPPIDPTQIGVFFHKVLNADNGYVLEVNVPRSQSELLYFNSSGATWVRLNGSKKKLQGSALQDYIIKRTRKDF